MATSDVDQLVLGQLAKTLPPSRLATALFQILGLSVMLSKAMFQARKQRRLDTSRDTKSLRLYQRIIWLANQGLTILQADVLPFTEPATAASRRLPSASTASALFGASEPGKTSGQSAAAANPSRAGEVRPGVAIARPELPVLAAKLHASFFHTFCLFHNNPPVQSVWPFTSTAAEMHQFTGNSEDLAALEMAAALSSQHTSAAGASPPTTTPTGSKQQHQQSAQAHQYPDGRTTNGYHANRDTTMQQPQQQAPLSPPLSPALPAKDATAADPADPSLRGPIPSVASESSYVTNPFANVPPGRPFSGPNLGPDEAQFLASLNQNMSPTSAAAFASHTRPGQGLSTPPERLQTPADCLAAPSTPPAFIIPSRNFVPEAATLFDHSSRLAAETMAPSHPLRLSVALEHAAFLWDIVHDFDAAKRVARQAIQLVSTDDEPLTDSDFETAAVMVTLLGKFRRREVPASVIANTSPSAQAQQPESRTQRRPEGDKQAPMRAESQRQTQHESHGQAQAQGPNQTTTGPLDRLVQYNQRALDDLTGVSRPPQSQPQPQPQPTSDEQAQAQAARHRQQQAHFQSRHRHSPDKALREEYSLGESLHGRAVVAAGPSPLPSSTGEAESVSVPASVSVSATHSRTPTMAAATTATAPIVATTTAATAVGKNHGKATRYDFPSPTIPVQPPVFSSRSRPSGSASASASTSTSAAQTHHPDPQSSQAGRAGHRPGPSSVSERSGGHRDGPPSRSPLIVSSTAAAAKEVVRSTGVGGDGSRHQQQGHRRQQSQQQQQQQQRHQAQDHHQAHNNYYHQRHQPQPHSQQHNTYRQTQFGPPLHPTQHHHHQPGPNAFSSSSSSSRHPAAEQTNSTGISPFQSHNPAAAPLPSSLPLPSSSASSSASALAAVTGYFTGPRSTPRGQVVPTGRPVGPLH